MMPCSVLRTWIAEEELAVGKRCGGKNQQFNYVWGNHNNTSCFIPLVFKVQCVTRGYDSIPEKM